MGKKIQPVKLALPNDLPEVRAEAIARMMVIKTHPGWLYLQKVMDLNIETLEQRLLTEEFDDINEVKRIQDQIYYQKTLRDYPEFVINSLEPKEDKKFQLDPYQ